MHDDLKSTRTGVMLAISVAEQERGASCCAIALIPPLIIKICCHTVIITLLRVQIYVRASLRVSHCVNILTLEKIRSSNFSF